MTKDWKGNSNSIYKTIGASNHTEKEREQNDYYATDPIAIDKLLAVETPSNNIWECACGGGHLLNRLKELGFNAFGTDLVDRGQEQLLETSLILNQKLWEVRWIFSQIHLTNMQKSLF